MRKTEIFCLLILFISAASLRMYPYILRFTPYMTDSWPIIHLAEEISKNTPTPFKGGDLFGEYNIYWPMVAVLIVETAHLTNLKIIETAPLIIPLTAALSIFIFYLLTLKLTGKKEIAFASTMLFAACGFHSILTAGAKKETLANPLYFTILYLYIFSKGKKKAFLYLLCFTTLVATHHLTTLVTVVILLNIALASTISSIKKSREINKEKLFLIIASLFITLTYYLFYAYKGFKYVFGFTDFISIFSFQAITWIPVLRTILTPDKMGNKKSLTPFIVATAAIFLLTLISFKPLIPGAPVIPLKNQVTIIPYELVALIAAYGYVYLKEDNAKEKVTVCLVWFTSILGLEGYAFFSSQYGLVVAYRLLNFLYPPLAVFAGAGVAAFLKKKKPLQMFLYFVLLIALSTGTAYQSYTVVVEKNNYFGGQGVYTQQDLKLIQWIKKQDVGKRGIASDQKINYLLMYIGRKADVLDGFLYLKEVKKQLKNSFLITYKDMEERGYYLTYYGLKLPKGYIKKLNKKGEMNIIYVNNQDKMYMKLK